MRKFAISVFLATIAIAGSVHAQSAMDELRRATGGNTTGQTFDGGPTPTDATPSGNTVDPPTPSSGTATSPPANPNR